MAVRLLAGASGYAYKPWKGPFYPADLPNADMLAYYAERLPTVEINNTFYRMPKTSVLETWAEQTPAAFRFVLKASRRITHLQRLKDVGENVAYLLQQATALGAKLGPLLFQLPPNLKKDTERLAAFLELIPADRPIALEFRHDSWHDDDVLDLLRAHDAALCLAETDPDDDSDADDGDEDTEPPQIVATAGWGYLRLRRADYTDADLTAWAERISAQPWREAYVFFKHEDEGAAPRLAQRLMALAEPQRA